MAKIGLALSVLTLSLVVSASASAAAATNYPGKCNEMIKTLKKSGDYSEICSQIQTSEAFRCLNTVVSSAYIQNAWGWGIDLRLGRSTFYACGEVTPQAIGAVELMLQKHPDASSDLIRVVGHATAKTQVACLEKIVHEDRGDVDEDNILSICPQ